MGGLHSIPLPKPKQILKAGSGGISAGHCVFEKGEAFPMFRYILKRFLYMFITLFCITAATFFLMHSIPGDPLSYMAKKLPDQTREVEGELAAPLNALIERGALEVVKDTPGGIQVPGTPVDDGGSGGDGGKDTGKKNGKQPTV